MPPKSKISKEMIGVASLAGDETGNGFRAFMNYNEKVSYHHNKREVEVLRKVAAIVCVLLLAGSAAFAQGKVVSTEKAPKAIGPYSQAVEANGMLFVSGQIPLDPATGKVVEGGIAEQTTRVMENIKAILDQAGYSFANVVKSTCLLSDMANFKGMNEVYARY